MALNTLDIRTFNRCLTEAETVTALPKIVDGCTTTNRKSAAVLALARCFTPRKRADLIAWMTPELTARVQAVFAAQLARDPNYTDHNAEIFGEPSR